MHGGATKNHGMRLQKASLFCAVQENAYSRTRSGAAPGVSSEYDILNIFWSTGSTLNSARGVDSGQGLGGISPTWEHWENPAEMIGNLSF